MHGILLYFTDNNDIQHLSTSLVVHLGQTISCPLLGFPVTVEPEISAIVEYTIRHCQVTVVIEELLVCFAKV